MTEKKTGLKVGATVTYGGEPYRVQQVQGDAVVLRPVSGGQDIVGDRWFVATVCGPPHG